MHIRFKQTGGFAGLTKTFETELEELSAADASELRSLVDASRWRETSIPPAPSFPDAFSYQLEISDAGENRRFFFHDGNAPESLKPLLDWISDRARHAK